MLPYPKAIKSFIYACLINLNDRLNLYMVVHKINVLEKVFGNTFHENNYYK
jgi:hypothetical protein